MRLSKLEGSMASDDNSGRPGKPVHVEGARPMGLRRRLVARALSIGV